MRFARTYVLVFFSLGLAFFTLSFAGPLFAQVPTGVPQFGTFQPNPIDTVNLATLNIHFEIPIRETPGRKLPFAAALNEENSHYFPQNFPGRGWYWTFGHSSPPASWFFSGWPVRTLLPYGIPTGNSVTVKTCNTSAPWGGLIGSLQIANNVLTVYANPGFTVGQIVQFNGLTHATFLNGQDVQVTAVGQGYFTANLVHTDYPTQSDSGTVAVLTNLWAIAGYTDIHNTLHGPTPMLIDPYGCLYGSASSSSTSQDGYVTTAAITGLNLNPGQGSYTLTVTVTTPSGTLINSGPMQGNIYNGSTGAGPSASTATDTNGNQISVTNPPGGLTLAYTDATGNNVLTAASTQTGATYSYTGPNSTTETVTVTSGTAFNVQTNFACPGIGDFTGSASLPNRISLPDGSSYQVGYDTIGRVSSVTLPAGGTTSYNYNGPNNGISCQDGGSSGFTRTSPDGAWTYARSYSSPTGVWTTTVTDPQGNNSVYTFSGPLTLTWVQGNNTSTTIVQPEYEVQRQVYQLINGTQTLMETVLTCYNGNFTNCATATVTPPISQIDRYTYFPGVTNPSLSETKYNNSELLTEDKEFDFNAALPPASNQVSDRVIQYGTYSGGTCSALGNNLLNRPCTDTTTGGGSTLAQTTYQYDANGNLLSLGRLVSGSTFLTQGLSYYSSGLINVATDVNGATTTYTYGACNGSFPTTISEPLGLTRTIAWDCSGEVPTSVTDENGQPTLYGYVSQGGTADPFWRLLSTTDPVGNVTRNIYSGATLPRTEETVLLFNNNSSTVDTLTTFDGLGRPIISQTRQAPGSSNFDTVSTTYDSLGRVASSSVPCVKTASQPCGATPGTTTTYDSLSRPLSVVDGGGGSVSYGYSKNDVLVTVGPAPAGESTKRRQLEYDGLSRLTSVCEMTTASGSGTCGQTVANTGYWTKYLYDGLGNLTGVTQNAQAASTQWQTRSYAYDGLSRLISETNPESGTTSYAFDALTNDSSCKTVSFPGDLVKKTDADNNILCYTYDPLHRATTITCNASVDCDHTPFKTFVYDSATVNGQVMQNTKGRLARTYADVGGSDGSDLGFSYNARGEVSDVYESTQNSGGYYHVAQTYWPNGAIASLSGSISALPSFTYGLDGEGRIKTVSASTGQNPITAVSYNAASLPTQVTFGSGDNDIFAYDSNTLRMTQYKFNVGKKTKSLIGSLTWNANGTLGRQVITDAFNSANTQTCNYSHDDLVRIASANCGTAASQTFSYDPFGNISKSGSPYSFQPTYDIATNRFATVPGGTPSYLANGNVLSDGTHTYRDYDADGHPHAVDTAGETAFDNLDRPVETNFGPTQFVYSPSGSKLAIMNGQTLKKAFVPLPGQAVAVYTSSGLDHYRHSDWLGSTRLTSTPSRTVSSTVAYAPFGETYAQSGTADLSFTGMNSDTTSGDYDFPARYYSTQGRWPSPDPAGIRAVDPSNPQSWNRYVYVLNNPLAAIDPLGLDCVYLNAAGTGVDPNGIDRFSDATECGQHGGVWFNGTIDPNSVRTDANSDWVFANGSTGNNQFSCAIDGACDQESLTAFSQSVIGGAQPIMVYGQGSDTGTIISPWSFEQTVSWFAQEGYLNYKQEGSHDPWHFGQYNLRTPVSYCSVHIGLTPNSSNGPNASTTGDFHVDIFNPWETSTSLPSGDVPRGLVQATGHVFADILAGLANRLSGPGRDQIKPSRSVCP